MCHNIDMGPLANTTCTTYGVTHVVTDVDHPGDSHRLAILVPSDFNGESVPAQEAVLIRQPQFPDALSTNLKGAYRPW